VLDGEKRYIGNSNFADLVVVWARDVADDEVKGFVVRTDTPGFSATKMENKLALRTVQNADIVLSGCRVPHADKLAGATRSRTRRKCCS
jgi:glutaryl-CoA dehydrogenase